MIHKTCWINYGHLADLEKTLPTTDLNKKTFIWKYLLTTLIFFLSFQYVPVFCLPIGLCGLRVLRPTRTRYKIHILSIKARATLQRYSQPLKSAHSYRLWFSVEPRGPAWCQTASLPCLWRMYPDSKVHGANMGHTWVLSALDEPHVAQWTLLSG